MTKYNIIRDVSTLREMVSHYRKMLSFTFDVETVGMHRLDPRRNEVTWISFACADSTDVVPMGHPNGHYIETEYPLLASGRARMEKGLELRPIDYSRDERKALKKFGPPPPQLHYLDVFEIIEDLMFDEDIVKQGHNLKFDLKSVAKYYGGEIPAGPYFDTMIASWVLDSRLIGELNLAACVGRELNHELVKGVGAEVEKYSFDEVAEYSANDSHWTHELAYTLHDKLVSRKMHKLAELEMDVLGAVCRMELNGVNIDQKALQGLHADLEEGLDEAKAKIYQVAGRVFNINSNLEKQKLLFGKKAEGGRGLRPTTFTKGGAPSVSAEALEKFRGRDELASALLEYADLNKLMSTYVIPYLGGEVERTTGGKTKLVQKEALLVNGKVYTDFQQHGTETGRFSSRNPNLQNIPNAKKVSEEEEAEGKRNWGKEIRNLFYAPEGELVVCADYSQIEPRIIASFSKDPTLVSAYEEGRDVYVAMADPLGLPRAAGKLAVLSMSYGVGPDKVERELKLARGEGKKVLNGFERQFRDVYRYKRHVIAEAANRRPVPYVTTLLGRRRYLPDLVSSDPGLRARAERQAFNAKIQGTAADIMKIAIVRADAMLPPEAHLVLTVHDELLVICPENMAEEVAEVLREAMENIPLLDLPLKADVEIGKTWGEAKK